MAQFAEVMNYTAMSLGNHEFDDGAAGIVPFAESITFPLLAANLEEEGEPYLSNHYTKSVVVEVEGTKVGIVGYITKFTQGRVRVFFKETIEAMIKFKSLIGITSA